MFWALTCSSLKLQSVLQLTVQFLPGSAPPPPTRRLYVQNMQRAAWPPACPPCGGLSREPAVVMGGLVGVDVLPSASPR